MTTSKLIDISIQGNIYQIKCPASQEEHLIAAARNVDKKMSLAKKNTPNQEKAAILTALNIAHELIEYKQEHNNKTPNTANEQIMLLINNIHESITKKADK